jgi:hypothetical protein
VGAADRDADATADADADTDAGDDAAVEADAIGAVVADEVDASVALGTGVTRKETARGDEVSAAVNPTASTIDATTPPRSNRRTPIRRLAGNRSRHRGQNPETGVVV